MGIRQAHSNVFVSINNIKEVTNHGIGSQADLYYASTGQGSEATGPTARNHGSRNPASGDQFLIRHGIGETQNPFADLIGMFEGPSEGDHDDIYR
jgi:hypothetical protein